MANRNNRTVQPNPDGGWDVKADNAKRASAHTGTQAEAVTRGRRIVGNAGGGELKVKGRDGRVRAQDTVPPGNDPRRSKG